MALGLHNGTSYRFHVRLSQNLKSLTGENVRFAMDATLSLAWSIKGNYRSQAAVSYRHLQ